MTDSSSNIRPPDPDIEEVVRPFPSPAVCRAPLLLFENTTSIMDPWLALPFVRQRHKRNFAPFLLPSVTAPGCFLPLEGPPHE